MPRHVSSCWIMIGKSVKKELELEEKAFIHIPRRQLLVSGWSWTGFRGNTFECRVT